jgi:hypothetical protein
MSLVTTKNLNKNQIYYSPNLWALNRPFEFQATKENQTFLETQIKNKILHNTKESAVTAAEQILSALNKQKIKADKNAVDTKTVDMFEVAL